MVLDLLVTVVMAGFRYRGDVALQGYTSRVGVRKLFRHRFIEHGQFWGLQ